jgi:hypothetical protein
MGTDEEHPQKNLNGDPLFSKLPIDPKPWLPNGATGVLIGGCRRWKRSSKE